MTDWTTDERFTVGAFDSDERFTVGAFDSDERILVPGWQTDERFTVAVRKEPKTAPLLEPLGQYGHRVRGQLGV
jgi:hypothetical protein